MEYLHENKNRFLNMINLTSERLHMLPFIVEKISIKKLLDEIVNQNIYQKKSQNLKYLIRTIKTLLSIITKKEATWKQ